MVEREHPAQTSRNTRRVFPTQLTMILRPNCRRILPHKPQIKGGSVERFLVFRVKLRIACYSTSIQTGTRKGL
jgi:hypothetical protein